MRAFARDSEELKNKNLHLSTFANDPARRRLLNKAPHEAFQWKAMCILKQNYL